MNLDLNYPGVSAGSGQAGVVHLDVALLKREDLPHSCLSGCCGTCIAKVCDGEVAMDEAPFLALTQQERADGYVLACLTEPRSRQVTMKFTG